MFYWEQQISKQMIINMQSQTIHEKDKSTWEKDYVKAGKVRE